MQINPRILKITKRILLILLITFVTLIVTGFLIAFFYGDEIKKQMLAQLNKQLTTEVTVKDIGFSVLRNFPNASLELSNVLVKEVSDEKVKDTLLYADHISLLFNLMGVFSRDYTLKKIIVKDGIVKLKMDAKGNENYHFWKSSPDSLDKKSKPVDLQDVELKDINITWSDKKAKQDYRVLMSEGICSGKFSDDEFKLSAKGNLFVDHFISDSVNFVQRKEAQLDMHLLVNSKANSYTFSDSKLKIADLDFEVKGKIVSGETTYLNLAVEAKEADLASFISMLPEKIAKQFDDFSSSGKFFFNAKIVGDEGEKKSPAINISFGVKDGKMNPGKSSVALNEINFTGTFSNKNSSGKVFEILDIPSFKASLGEREISGQLKLENFDQPFLTLQARANLSLADMQQFAKLDTLDHISGDVDVNISFAGSISDYKQKSPDAIALNTDGKLIFKNVNFSLKNNNLEFKNLNGTFALRDRDLAVSNLAGEISSTDFRLDGMFTNLIAYALGTGAQTTVDVNFSSREVNLDELLANKQESGSDTLYKLKFPEGLDMEMRVNIGNLHFRKFAAGKISGLLNLEDKILTGKSIAFSSMQGTMKLNGTINASRGDSILISCDAAVRQLDISQLFYQLENFGEDVLTDKHLKGTVNSDLQFASRWSDNLKVNSKTIIAQGDITIQNGELNNFKPMLALSRFIKVSDLEHIRFSDLKNSIEIRDRRVIIPSMVIQSNAMNLTLSGSHTFDNQIDYHLKMLLSDLLGKKVKQQNSEFGEIEDDGLGKTSIFIHMQGDISNPSITYDKKAVMDKIKTDVKQEKENLKNILKNEFNWFKKDTVKTEEKKKKEELQIDWDEEEKK